MNENIWMNGGRKTMIILKNVRWIKIYRWINGKNDWRNGLMDEIQRSKNMYGWWMDRWINGVENGWMECCIDRWIIDVKVEGWIHGQNKK